MSNVCKIAWKIWCELWIELLALIENFVELLWLNLVKPSECDHLTRHVVRFELLWLSVVRPSECDHLAKHVAWYELLWYWSWTFVLWDWVWGCLTLGKFIWMSCDELVFRIDSYECANGFFHLKGHFDDDPKEGRGLFPLFPCYVCVCAHDGGYL